MAEKKAEKPPEKIPKKFQKLDKLVNSTLEAIRTGKSRGDIENNLRNIFNTDRDLLLSYMVTYDNKFTAIIFGELWKIPKFQEYVDKQAGGISPFAMQTKGPEQSAFESLFWFVKDVSNVEEAIRNSSSKMKQTAAKAVFLYLTEYVPYSNKPFEKEIGSVGFVKGIEPDMDTKLLFASLLYLRRHYGVKKGIKNADIPVLDAKPKIKTVPKKQSPVPAKVKKEKKKKKEKHTKIEKQILKELADTKEAIEAWYELMGAYAQQYGVVFTDEKDATIENVLLELHSSGKSYLAAKELLAYADVIINSIDRISKKIAKNEMYGHFTKEYSYRYVFLFEGNMLESAVDTAKERLGLKKSEFMDGFPGMQEMYDEFKAEQLTAQMPSFAPDTSPIPSPAEQAEIEAMVHDPYKAACVAYGPTLCRAGDYKISKKEKLEALEMLILFVPVVGPVYSLGMDVKRIKDRVGMYKDAKKMEKELQIMLDAEAERLENEAEAAKGTLSSDEIHFMMEQAQLLKEASGAGDWKVWATEGAMVTMDIAFLGLDVAFIGSFAVKGGAKWIGRDALAVMEKEVAAGKLVTQVEKDIMGKAMTELSSEEMKHFLALAKNKGGVRKVVEEMAEIAGDSEITTKVMKKYLKKNPLPTGFAAGVKKTKGFVKNEVLDLEDGLSVFSKQKFRKQLVSRFYKDLIPNIDFKAVSEISDLMHSAKLGKDAKYAEDIILSTMFSFDKAPQKFLLKGLKEGKFTWSELVDLVKYEEKMLIEGGMMAAEAEIRGTAARNVLKKVLPSYEVAYIKAPYEELAKTGVFLAGVAAGFGPALEFIRAKTESQHKKYEQEMKKFSNPDELDSLMEMYSASAALTGGI